MYARPVSTHDTAKPSVRRLSFPNDPIVLMRWWEPLALIVCRVWEEPAACYVGHGVVLAMLYTPLRKEAPFIAAPVLPFSCVEQATVNAVRWRAFLVPAKGTHRVNRSTMLEELLLRPEASR